MVSTPHTDAVTLDGVDDAGLAAWAGAFSQVFGSTLTDDRLANMRAVLELDRLVAATDADGEVVGTSGAYSFDLSLPGGTTAPCAGVTLVSVRADHRRRGLLTRMMERLLDDAEARGEPFAALWASESPIYGRFGFGSAAPTVNVELRRDASTLHLDGPVDEVELLSLDAATERFPAIREAHRATRPGALSYDDRWWRGRILADPAHRREQAGPVRCAWLPDRGFAVYRVSLDWAEDGPAGRVEVEELVALDPAAHAALWRFVIDTDLTASTFAVRRPVDDPLFALLVDPERVRYRPGGPLELRLVDVPTALAARRYGVDGTVVFELADGFRSRNAGRWRLEVRDGTATCTRTEDPVDVRLDVSDLGAVYLGGTRTTQLVSAGRVDASLAAAATLDRLFATDIAPWHGGMF